MPFFTVYAKDRAGKAETRQALRPEHRERLRRHDFDLTIHTAGPLLDAAGAMCGTLLIVEAADQAEVERFVAGDPYVAKGDLYESCEIRPFQWGLGQPGETRDG